jgi:hypothetical protein
VLATGTKAQEQQMTTGSLGSKEETGTKAQGTGTTLSGAGSLADMQPCYAFETMSVEKLAELMTKVGNGSLKLNADNQKAMMDHFAKMDNERFKTLIAKLDNDKALFPFLKEEVGERMNSTDPASPIKFEVPVLCYRLWNATDRMDKDVKTANKIYNHDGIGVVKASQRDISKAEAEKVTGKTLSNSFAPDATTAKNAKTGSNDFTSDDMKKIVAAYVPKTVIAGVWMKDVTSDGDSLAGYSTPEYWHGAGFPKMAAVSTDHCGDDTFAHELGHVLTNDGHRESSKDNLMHSGGERNKDNTGTGRLDATEVSKIKSSAMGWVVKQCRV